MSSRILPIQWSVVTETEAHYRRAKDLLPASLLFHPRVPLYTRLSSFQPRSSNTNIQAKCFRKHSWISSIISLEGYWQEPILVSFFVRQFCNEKTAAHRPRFTSFCKSEIFHKRRTYVFD